MRHVLDSAMMNFYAFTLVLLRMAGLMTIGPLFGQSVVPANVRIMLVLAMSIIITPALHQHSRVGFTRLDQNQDGHLSRSEIPDGLLPRFERRLEQAGKRADGNLNFSEFDAAARLPNSLVDYAWIGITEFALGFMIGLGVFTILSGVQLAGQLIDQQSGVALGEVFNPGLDVAASLSGQLLYLLAVVIFLVMEPINGHLLMVSALVETFQALPVAEASVSVSAMQLLNDIIQQSLLLAVQVAAPLLATMSLVALAMGFLGHTVPQINVLVVGFPIRVLVSLMILSLTISSLGTVIVDTIPRVIDEIRYALTSLQ